MLEGKMERRKDEMIFNNQETNNKKQITRNNEFGKRLIKERWNDGKME
jgi:hypothetical protein